MPANSVEFFELAAGPASCSAKIKAIAIFPRDSNQGNIRGPTVIFVDAIRKHGQQNIHQLSPWG